MSGLALMELQRALYTKLEGDGVLAGMITGVYDSVPQETALPYVVIGDGELSNLPNLSAALVSECRLDLHVWTAAGGRKTALTIMDRLHALLHLGSLTLTGYQTVLLRVERAQTQLTDRDTRVHGTLVVVANVAE